MADQRGMENFIARAAAKLISDALGLAGPSFQLSRLSRKKGPACALLALVLGLNPMASAVQLTIAWDITSDGQLGFNIERSQDGTTFTQVATVAATVNTYTDLDMPTGSYWYRVRAFNAVTFSPYSNVASTIMSVSAPSFTTQPASASAAMGASATFSAVAIGSPTPTYQWKKNGVNISGATSSVLTLASLTSEHAGTYSVTATNSAGSVSSIGAVLSLTGAALNPPPVETVPVETALASRLRNLSARAIPGKGGQNMKMEFDVTASSTPVLLRAVGPGLAAFSATTVFVDPKLTLSNSGVTLSSNDNWGGSSALSTVFTQVGAFPLAANSKDAALVQTLSPSQYSAALGGKGSGSAMMEVYDAGNGVGRVSRCSVTALVGTGEERLIGGFTISGTAPLRVLIRAVGPSLGGGKGILKDPQLELHAGTTLLQRNDNWGGSAALKSSFTLAQASTLDGMSKDSAIDVTLAPGTYTATVAGVNGTTGTAQLEVYEIR